MDASARTWPAVVVDLPAACWTWTDGVLSTRVRIGGYTLTLTGLEVTTDDGTQTAVDTTRERHLLELYPVEGPWQVWHADGRDYALYAVPAADQDGPVQAEVDLDRTAWSGTLPEMEEPDRKLVTVVIAGHCALHLDARRVTGPGQEFTEYPEDRDALAALAGHDGPFPTLTIDGDPFVVFAYPHGQ